MCGFTNGALAKQIMFAGYTSGSTLGAGSLLLAIMLTRCKASPWQLPEVVVFLRSIARIKATFVIHASPEARAADAWRIKASGQQLEEHHCLMAANMLIQAHIYEAGWVWTNTNLSQSIQDLNNNVASINDAHIGSWKERSVRNIILYMTSDVVQCLQNAYSRWGWENSFMSEDLVRQAFWKPGHKFKTSSAWQEVFTTSAPALLLYVNKLSELWSLQWPAPGSLQAATNREIESQKPCKAKDRDPELQDMNWANVLLLMTLFYQHWLLPRVETHYGKAGVKTLQAIMKMFIYIYVVVNMANFWLSSNSTFECFVGRMQKYIYFSEVKIFYLVVSNYLCFYNWLLGL